MPRFRPLGRRLRLNATLDGIGNPLPSVIPSKILEPNPRRKFLYVENVGGDADPLRLTGEFSPKLGSGDDTLLLGSDTFAGFRNENPLVLEYAGPLNGLMDSIPTRIDEGFYFGELVDDVDVAPQGTLTFISHQYTANQLVGQPGPLYQPTKVYEAKPGVRFVLLETSGAGQIVLTNAAAPITVEQGFRLPAFWPFVFKHPFVPSRSLFAFDVSGAGGRMVVTVGYA